MKKLIGPFAKVGGSLFALGVAVIMVSLSFAALGRVFPGRLFDQAAGLLLFDAACLVWFSTFIANSKSTMQYVFAGVGFLLGLLGTLGLVAIEVGISSGLLNAADMMKPLNYVFIGAAIGHLVTLYAFHVSAPEISSDISMGVELAKLEDEGMRQAELQVRQNMQQLGTVISSRIYARLLSQLNMPTNILDTHFLPAHDDLHVPSNGYPVEEKAPSFFSDPREWFKKKFTRSSPTTDQLSEDQVKGQEIVWLEPEGPDGPRVRLYCLFCLKDKKPWRTPEPCSHVLNATGAAISPLSSGYAMNVESVSIPGADAGVNTATKPASKQPTENAGPYAHLYPPNGDRQNIDFLLARMPSDEWQKLHQAWIDYDNSRFTELLNQAESAGPNEYDPAWHRNNFNPPVNE